MTYNDVENGVMKEIMMKEFDYKNRPKALLTPDIVGMLTSIHEHIGKQELFIEANAHVLVTLLEVAKIQSTASSNRIEGIFTTDKRLEELFREKSKPRNLGEEGIARYRDVLPIFMKAMIIFIPVPILFCSFIMVGGPSHIGMRLLKMKWQVN